jgi:AraC family transcriptional regulator, transcriptional activator of pobA
MQENFKIFKISPEEAKKIASEPNEPHFHDFEELIIGMEGQLEHFIDFKAAIFKAPYISFVTKGKLHRVIPSTSGGKCDIWVMRFSSEFIPETTFRLYSYYHDHANIEMKNNDSFKRMVILCEMMNGEMQQSMPNLSVVRDLLKTLFTMIEAEREKFSISGQTFPKTQNTTFRNFLKILEDNFRRPEGVDFYAEKLFMSARNLNLVTQNILHKSVSDIIETRKLIEAKNLLIYSDKTISEIGFELGYNEKAYFTSVFKKKSGQTPSEFRDAMRKIIS